MKRLLSIILGSVLALSLISGVGASPPRQTANPTATPAPAPPVQGNKVNTLLYVDTVTGTTGSPAAVCAQTNLFKHGQMVVFRVWGVSVKAGGAALTTKNVKSAVVNIPGVDPVKLAYTAHTRGLPNPISYWEGAWVIPASYPIGVVDFSVVVTTKADKKHHLKSYTARFSQAPLSSASRLTVTP